MKMIFLLPFFLNLWIPVPAQNTSPLDSLLRILKTQKDTASLSTLLEIGKVLNNTGQLDSALYYLTPGLNLASKKGTVKQVCEMLYSIGRIKSSMSKYDEALENLFAILKMANKADIRELTPKVKKEIGAIYIYQKKEKEALPYLYEAEKEMESRKDTLGLFMVYSNLPVCIAHLGDTVKAMKFFNKGFSIIEDYEKGKSYNSVKGLTMRFKLAYTYNMNNFISKKEDLIISFDRMKIWQKEVLAGTNRFQQFILYCHLADISLRLDQYENAQLYGEQAVNFKEAAGNYTYLADVYWVITKASAALRQYEKAYNNLQLHRQNNDSIFKFSKIEAVNTVEAKYQVEKKEQQIITLNKEKKAQRTMVGLAIGGLLVALILLGLLFRSKKLQKKLLEQEKQIQKKEMEEKMAELEQTALRAQMNPHFIFNCLNSVQRFIISNDTEGANEYISSFANLIRQTLENSGKKLITLKDELRYLETYIKMEQLRSNNKFDYNITISPEIDQSETYIPNMIVQPYIENSIHHGMIHANNKKGFIKLDISKSNKLNFIIGDNGAGIKNKNIIQSMGDEHQSMGGAITEKRIAMYNSLHEDKIELQVLDKADTGSPESGTSVILKFPLNN